MTEQPCEDNRTRFDAKAVEWDANPAQVALVLVERGRTPRNGDIVIACVDAAWTMKYFYRDAKGIRLEPANKKFETIRPKRGLAVEGVVSSVIRKLV